MSGVESVVEIPYKGEGPMPLLREIALGEAYPVNALGPLQGIVEAVEDITQAPVAIAAQSALAVASLAVQGFANVETLGGYTPCSLFCLTVAASGERKSSCDRPLMEGVKLHEAERSKIYETEKAQYDVEYRIWSETQKRLIAESAGGNKDKGASAQFELDEMGPAPKAPLAPNIIASEPTFEGLLKLFHIGNPSLGVFTDEGGGFIGGHAMNSDNRLKTMAGLSRLWNGDAVDRTRAGDGAIIYRGRRLAAHIMMQPVVARTFLSDKEASGQGFLARFLISEPASNIGIRLRRGHSIDSDRELSSFEHKLIGVLGTPMPTGDSEQELLPRTLPLSSPARELLWRFYVHVEKAQAPGQEYEHISSFASKAAEQAARIAGVLMLWENLDAQQVTPESMMGGVTLAQYYLNESKRLIDMGNVSQETEQAELLREWLLEKWRHPEIVAKEVVQFGPTQLRETAKAKLAMKTLEKHGWLFRMPEGAVVRGQARKEAYRIVGKNHAL